MLYIKDALTEMKNSFDGLIGRLYDLGKNFELKRISKETFKTKKQRKKKTGRKKKSKYSGKITKGMMYKCYSGHTRKRRKERNI